MWYLALKHARFFARTILCPSNIMWKEMLRELSSGVVGWARWNMREHGLDE